MFQTAERLIAVPSICRQLPSIFLLSHGLNEFKLTQSGQKLKLTALDGEELKEGISGIFLLHYTSSFL
jgi:hypothetical protein